MKTLGQILDAIEPYKDKGGYVTFDWAGAYPDYVDSYRGFYDRLAIAYAGGYKSVSPKEFWDMLKAVEGEYLTGWKGGEYLMTRDTPVHVACQGRTSDTVVAGISVEEPSCFEGDAWITIITKEEK